LESSPSITKQGGEKSHSRNIPNDPSFRAIHSEASPLLRDADCRRGADVHETIHASSATARQTQDDVHDGTLRRLRLLRRGAWKGFEVMNNFPVPVLAEPPFVQSERTESGEARESKLRNPASEIVARDSRGGEILLGKQGKPGSGGFIQGNASYLYRNSGPACPKKTREVIK
jgi:hypothetical protein